MGSIGELEDSEGKEEWNVNKSKKKKKNTTDCGESASLKYGGEQYKVFVKLGQEGTSFREWNPIQLTKGLSKEIGELNIFTMKFPVLLLISYISTVVGMVSVLVTKPVISYCHKAITLQCNVSVANGKDNEIQVTHLSWIKESNKTICSESETSIKSFYHCQYMPNKQLELTIAHPKSDDFGRYICKLRSSHGHTSAETNVTVECPQKIVHIHEDGKNRMICKVERSNYNGHIHWFHGTVNLTSLSTQDTYSVDGSYTVVSSLNNCSNWKTYNCSYWVPQIEQYITSQKIVMEHNTQSSIYAFNSHKCTVLMFCLCLLWTLVPQ